MSSKLEVTSEVLPFFEKDIKSKPVVDDKNAVSRFTFTLPQASVQVDKVSLKKDKDGDYVVERKGREKLNENVIILEHSVSTELKLVGLQIWRAAFLVADYIIHFQDLFRNKTVLELGSGVGLTSIVAGMFSRQVICTDLDVGNILKLIKSNIERNKGIIKCPIHVFGFDFFNDNWSDELKEKIEEVDVIIAADVIYDNDVTEAFVKSITNILNTPPKKTLYIALEKRYVFTISDLDSVAPCYEHLMSCLKLAQTKAPFSQWKLTQISLDFPQYFNYEKVRQLIMYKIET